MSDGLVAWSVRLPDRHGRGLAGPARRAFVHISSHQAGEETLTVPIAVGRRLDSLSRDDGSSSLDYEELCRVIADVSQTCAHARMEELVRRRDYSCRELTERLTLDGYESQTVERIVSRACEVGIVDDARYGAAFARSKVLSGWGRLRIERELERRGVDPRLVPGWPEDFLDDEVERERALGLASRRRLTGKNDYQKLVRFLCGRGFPLGLSVSVAKEVLGAVEV